jgi:hypothetical protein
MSVALHHHHRCDRAGHCAAGGFLTASAGGEFGISRAAFAETVADDGITASGALHDLALSGTVLRRRRRETRARSGGRDLLPGAPDLLDERTRSELLARRCASPQRSRAHLVRQAVQWQQAELDVRRLEELAAEEATSRASASERR